jgi:hypothetical protein
LNLFGQTRIAADVATHINSFFVRAFDPGPVEIRIDFIGGVFQPNFELIDFRGTLYDQWGQTVEGEGDGKHAFF